VTLFLIPFDAAGRSRKPSGPYRPEDIISRYQEAQRLRWNDGASHVYLIAATDVDAARARAEWQHDRLAPLGLTVPTTMEFTAPCGGCGQDCNWYQERGSDYPDLVLQDCPSCQADDRTGVAA
jgi:hypothetical protein